MIDLLSKLNVRREERVLMLVLDQIEFPIIFWGCIKAGVIPVPINTLLSKEIIKTILDDCRAKTIFVSQEIKDLIFDIPDLYNQIDNIFVIGKSDNNNDVKNFTTELDLCVEKEIIELKLSSPKKINSIASNITNEVIKRLIGTDVNESSVSALVEEELKKLSRSTNGI